MTRLCKAICAALQELGMRPYHFSEISKHEENKHFELWLSAVQAKYGGGKGRAWTTAEDFDRVLAGYDVSNLRPRPSIAQISRRWMGKQVTHPSCQAVSDDPCCLFAEELIAAYPDAKLVLTRRASSEVWYRSMKSFTLEILAWQKSFALLSFLDREFTAPYMALLNRTTRVLSGGIEPMDPAARPMMEEFYDEHTRRVEQLAAANGRELLIYEPGMGWESLCDFLGVPVPESPYPHLNSTAEALRLEWDLYWERWGVVVRGGLRRWFLPVVLGILVGGYLVAARVS